MQASPTLDLVNDCFRFVTGFFSIISTSSPHIYHSALPLSPKTSIVRRLYELHAHALTRVVYGLPTSWEESIMSVGFPCLIDGAVWSPCSRFIAITQDIPRQTGGSVRILDAVTLGVLSTFLVDESHETQSLTFSPDTHSLTFFGENEDRIISWDVQTGVLISDISLEQLSWPNKYHSEITYSTCGAMFGLFKYKLGTTTICTYNIISGTHIYSQSVEVKIKELVGVWAHGGCLQFAAKEPGIPTTQKVGAQEPETLTIWEVGAQEPETLTIWEVGFTSAHTLTKVKSLPIPHRLCGDQLSYNPTLSWLISNKRNAVCVWDTKHSKYLLGPPTSFVYTSFNGPFFIWGDSGVDLLEEPPTGCVLYQRFIFNTSGNPPHISPNGELAFIHSRSVVQLWHTTDSNSPLPTTSTQLSQTDRSSSLFNLSQTDRSSSLFRLSRDEALAAVIQRGSKVVTVLDLKSGIPQLIIDTGMDVYGLGIARNTIVVVGYGKIVTWDLPAGGCVLNPRVNINDSVKATTFDQPWGSRPEARPLVLVSPDLHHIVIINQDYDTVITSRMDLFDVLTGQHLGWGGGSGEFEMCSFAPDGDEVWDVHGATGDRWKILKSGKFNTIELVHLGSAKVPMGAFPWQCPPGYQVTDDGWILHTGRKRLLWLPPHWWPDLLDRAWHGQFLALLKLPEVLILDLE